MGAGVAIATIAGTFAFTPKHHFLTNKIVAFYDGVNYNFTNAGQAHQGTACQGNVTQNICTFSSTATASAFPASSTFPAAQLTTSPRVSYTPTGNVWQ